MVDVPASEGVLCSLLSSWLREVVPHRKVRTIASRHANALRLTLMLKAK